MVKVKRISYASFFIGLTFIFAATSGTAQTISRSQIGAAYQISYGTVERVERVKIKSGATKGAVMGGLIGGATSGHHHRGKHALEGALAGAFLSALLEGNRKAYQYTVDFDNGSVTKVITENGGIQRGDCVAVELGQTANIRRTSSVHCEHREHESMFEPIVHAKRQTEAAECHVAKEMALQATTEVATDIALKKVRVFCEG